ncbi:MAG: ATP-binding protein [Verrucomicrobiota bacterium]
MSDFIFAEAYVLEPSITRSYYESFSKGFVHKINNQIGIIQGFASLVQYEDNIPESIKEAIDQIQSATAATSAVNQAALIASGCSAVDQGQVDLAAMNHFLKEKCEGIAAEANVPLQFDFREGVPLVQGDTRHLSNIIEHLVRNAVEAAKEIDGGTVAVDAFAPGEASESGHVDLFIRNSSAELSADQISKSFEPFESTKGSDHFGLGLTISAVLANDMKMRLGLRYAEETTTAWLAMPVAA